MTATKTRVDIDRTCASLGVVRDVAVEGFLHRPRLVRECVTQGDDAAWHVQRGKWHALWPHCQHGHVFFNHLPHAWGRRPVAQNSEYQTKSNQVKGIMASELPLQVGSFKFSYLPSQLLFSWRGDTWWPHCRRPEELRYRCETVRC